MSKRSWTKLQNLPEDIKSGDITNLNDNELIIVTSQGAYKYNHTMEEWKLWINLNAFLLNSTLAFNKSNKKLYCCGPWGNGEMVIIDTKSQEINVHNSIFEMEGNQYPCLINVDNQIHVIGGARNTKHSIWNDDKKELEEVFDFATIITAEINCLRGSSLIHVPSKNILLLFGGKKNANPLNDIYEYSFANKEWRKWNDGIQFSASYAPAVLTKDERYIIIAGSFDGSVQGNDIFVLNIDEVSLKKSCIKCPQSGSHLIAITSNNEMDDLLVNGYIRFINDKIPMEIIDLMTQYYNMEMLHWIAYETNYKKPKEHHMIPVRDVIHSV